MKCRGAGACGEYYEARLTGTREAILATIVSDKFPNKCPCGGHLIVSNLEWKQEKKRA